MSYLVPGSSLKGLMKAAARGVFPARQALIDDVYGTAASGSPWSWSSAGVDAPARRRRARVAIDRETMTASAEALLFAEEVWAVGATFTVDLLLHLPDGVRFEHERVLLASAHAVHALGSDRRRGLGWIGIAGTDPVLDEAAMVDIVRLAAARAAPGAGWRARQ